jgi:murein L,D-transpeptidase YafK
MKYINSKKYKYIALAMALALSLAVWPSFHSAQPALPVGTKADLLLVEKAKRTLTVYAKGRSIRTYHIALGRSPVGAKQCEGDDRSPEGNFKIDGRLPGSSCHRALHVSYPGPGDLERARAGHYQPGGSIMIHGIKNGSVWLRMIHPWVDWTRGCIAVTDPEIEELWRIVPNGTPIQIKP